jgi:hypothetical protein
MRQMAVHDAIRRAIVRSAVVWRVGTGCIGVSLGYLRPCAFVAQTRGQELFHLVIGLR